MRYEALGITDGAMMVTIGIFRDQSNCSDVETAVRGEYATSWSSCDLACV